MRRTLAGIDLSIACLAPAVVFLVQKLINPNQPLGWASIIVSVLFIGGVQMVFLGLIGEYLGKLYLDANGTPQWVMKKMVFFDRSSGSTPTLSFLAQKLLVFGKRWSGKGRTDSS